MDFFQISVGGFTKVDLFAGVTHSFLCDCHASPQISTSVLHCLVSMAAPVGTWWDPSSASVPRVSVGSAVRQVESTEEEEEEEELSGLRALSIRTYAHPQVSCMLQT